MNDEALLEDSHAQQQGYAPLGEVLAAARKAKKLSEQDVSNNLRISLKQIKDIENNEFSTLPQPMITRGFIRNYARMLGIDAEPLLESYRARVPDTLPKSVSVQSSSYQVVSAPPSQSWLRYILGSIVILLFLLAWIFYIDYLPKQTNLKNEKHEVITAAIPTAELKLPEVALPAAERQTDPAEVVTGAESGTTTTAVTLPGQAASTPESLGSNNAVLDKSTATSVDGASTKNAISTNSTTAVPPTTTAPAQTNGAVDFNTLKEKAAQNVSSANKGESNALVPAQKVQIAFTEKTWIQATDRTGKIIYERTLPAGSVDGFDGQPPFNIVIGNAKATKLSFLGKPVDLAPSTTQNNVARIKLE